MKGRRRRRRENELERKVGIIGKEKEEDYIRRTDSSTHVKSINKGSVQLCICIYSSKTLLSSSSSPKLLEILDISLQHLRDLIEL